MPRFRFILTLLVVSVIALLSTLNGAARPAAAPSTSAVDEWARERRAWYDSQRVERDQLAALGFSIVVEQRGLVLIEHDSGHCFMSPSMTVAYIETDPDLCASAHKRIALVPPVDPAMFMMGVLR